MSNSKVLDIDILKISLINIHTYKQTKKNQTKKSVVDKVTTMTANMMRATISAMTMEKMTKMPAYANAIIHGDVQATMEMMTMNCMKILVPAQRSTRVSTADKITAAPILDVIAIVQKTSVNCVKNSMKTSLNKM